MDKEPLKKDPERGKWASGLERPEILQELRRRYQNRMLTASSTEGTRQARLSKTSKSETFHSTPAGASEEFHFGRSWGKGVHDDQGPTQTNISRVYDEARRGRAAVVRNTQAWAFVLK